jgi:hypothetical protein
MTGRWHDDKAKDKKAKILMIRKSIALIARRCQDKRDGLNNQPALLSRDVIDQYILNGIRYFDKILSSSGSKENPGSAPKKHKAGSYYDLLNDKGQEPLKMPSIEMTLQPKKEARNRYFEEDAADSK